jgi:hypothetical protein
MDKYLLRLSMDGMLPKRIRTRPKMPLSGDPYWASLAEHGRGFPDPSALHPRLDAFVDRAKLPVISADTREDELWTHLRPVSLGFWFQNQSIISL